MPPLAAMTPTKRFLMWIVTRGLVFGLLGSSGVGRAMCAQVGDWKTAKYIYEFGAKDIDGEDVALEKYRGFVCIITNVASK
ncbi:unnamed protein product [Oncorhynchus mykiss]|uniref:Uncharacterized protein n=1 Tax=Oncorhynchus mykiss TaxID=8022 RepID=A0A060XLI9_ONCMY|nr:unnamed protein product [Oncorhynchus mykiss]